MPTTHYITVNLALDGEISYPDGDLNVPIKTGDEIVFVVQWYEPRNMYFALAFKNPNLSPFDVQAFERHLLVGNPKAPKGDLQTFHMYSEKVTQDILPNTNLNDHYTVMLSYSHIYVKDPDFDLEEPTVA
jgi:hypothetical protein